MLKNTERQGSFTLYNFFLSDCDWFLLIMGEIGVGGVVAVAQCEHFHWVLYNPFVAMRRIVVTIRKKCTVSMSLQRQLCDKALIEKSGITAKWIGTPFWSNSICFDWYQWEPCHKHRRRIDSALTLTLGLKRALTLRVEEVDPPPEPVEETHVDEDPGCVVLYVSRVLGAVIRVIPETVVTTLLEKFYKNRETS